MTTHSSIPAWTALMDRGAWRQECWSALPFPTPEALSNPGIKPMSLASPALANGFFSTRATYKSTQRTIKVRETVAARVKRSRQFLPGTCSQTVLYLSTEAALVAEMLENLPAMQETWVQSLAWKDPLEEEVRSLRHNNRRLQAESESAATRLLLASKQLGSLATDLA